MGKRSRRVNISIHEDKEQRLIVQEVHPKGTPSTKKFDPDEISMVTTIPFEDISEFTTALNAEFRRKRIYTFIQYEGDEENAKVLVTVGMHPKLSELELLNLKRFLRKTKKKKLDSQK